MFSCEDHEVIVGGALDEGMPPLGSAQFECAIAVNTLAPLDGTLRTLLLENLQDTNRLMEN